MDFLEQELYEFSIVPVPSNPDAMREAKGVDLAPLVGWAEETLDTVRGPGLWVPHATNLLHLMATGDNGMEEVRQLLRSLKRDPASVVVPDAGGVAPGGSPHAAAVAGSSPAPATPELEKAPKPAPPTEPTVLRLVKHTPPSLSITSEQIAAAVQSAVKDAAQAAIRHATGRLD